MFFVYDCQAPSCSRVQLVNFRSTSLLWTRLEERVSFNARSPSGRTGPAFYSPSSWAQDCHRTGSPHFLPMRSFPKIYPTYTHICTYPALSLPGQEQVALILKSDKGRHRRPLHSHGLPQNVRFRGVRPSIHSREANDHPTFAFHCRTCDGSVFPKVPLPRTNHILQYSCEDCCHGPLPAEARPGEASFDSRPRPAPPRPLITCYRSGRTSPCLRRDKSRTAIARFPSQTSACRRRRNLSLVLLAAAWKRVAAWSSIMQFGSRMSACTIMCSLPDFAMRWDKPPPGYFTSATPRLS